MKRALLPGLLALGCWVAAESVAHAQVFVRAPFVRVQVGPGVAVRAPFVNLYFPDYGPAYVYPPGYVVPAPPLVAPPSPAVLPAPTPIDPSAPLPKQQTDLPPPVAKQPAQVMTLAQFGKTFQPKPGSYEVELMNPVTNQPTTVRFMLPEGTPKRVQIRDREIEFRYGVLRFVRIEFDKDGAQVVSR
jgi:hypothetical protein